MLSHNLKIIRNQRKISLRKLSDASGVSKTTLCDIEGDKVNPSLETVYKIAKALEIEVGELI